MEHRISSKNRLITLLLTILFCVAIFGSALWCNFGFSATAEESGGETTPAHRYEIESVSVSLKDGYTLSTLTNYDILYELTQVTVSYKDVSNETAKPTERILEVAKSGDTTTGEKVTFGHQDGATAGTVAITVTVTPPNSDEYKQQPATDKSVDYTVQSGSSEVVSGIIAEFNPSTGATLSTTSPVTAIKPTLIVKRVYANGVVNDSKVDNTEFAIDGNLFPFSVEGLSNGSKYSKVITVVGRSNELRNFSTQVILTGIEYVEPSRIDTPYCDSGELGYQVARNDKLNLNGVTVDVRCGNTTLKNIPITAFPDGCIKKTYYDASYKKLNTLSTAVVYVKLKVEYTATLYTEESDFIPVGVDKISIHTPHFPGDQGQTAVTLSWNDGAAIDMTNWDFSKLYVNSGSPAPTIEVYTVNAEGKETAATVSVAYEIDDSDLESDIKRIKFKKAGQLYRVKVVFAGTSDFKWGTPYNGSTSFDDITKASTISYDVQVDKSAPIVELKFKNPDPNAAKTTYGTPISDFELTAKIQTSEEGVTPVTYEYVGLDENKNNLWKEQNPAADKDTYKDSYTDWKYDLSYYTDEACTKPVESKNLREEDGQPKNGGTYYMKAVTYENGGYLSAKSEPLKFIIQKAEFNDSALGDGFIYDRKLHGITDFFRKNESTGQYEFAKYDEDKPGTVFEMVEITEHGEKPASAYVKAGTYKIKLTVKKEHETNYTFKENNEETSEKTFTIGIGTNSFSRFDFKVSDWTYGEEDADPKLELTANPTAGGKTWLPAWEEKGSNKANIANFVVKYYQDGVEVAIPQTDGKDDFTKLAAGTYDVVLTAKPNESEAAPEGESYSIDDTDRTVDYWLPNVTHQLVVATDFVRAPQLLGTWGTGYDEWKQGYEDQTPDFSRKLYTYNDKNATGAGFSFANWISNNQTADGKEIIIVKIEYENYKGETKTVEFKDTDGSVNGKFYIKEAGKYTVTITKNINYAWQKSATPSPALYKARAGEGESTGTIFTPTKDTYVYTGYVARQKVDLLKTDDIQNANDKEYCYTGKLQTKTFDLSAWNNNALKIVGVEIGKLDSTHTPIKAEGAIELPDYEAANVVGNAFKVTHAGKYTVKVEIKDKNNYEWKCDNETPSEGELLGDKTVEYTLERAPLTVTWTFTKGETTQDLDGTFAVSDNTKFPRYAYEVEREQTGQQMPTAKVKLLNDGDKIDIKAYKAYEGNNFNSPITNDKYVQDVGYYRRVVSEIDGDSLADYYLPANNSEFITQIATVFEIYSQALDKPGLSKNETDAVIIGKAIEVVFSRDGYKLSDFIADFNDKYMLDHKLRLDIKWSEEEGGTGVNNPTLKDVRWSDDETDKQIVVYTVIVKPGDNFGWKPEVEGGELTYDEIKYTVKITQLAVTFDWKCADTENKFTTVYGEVGAPSPIVTNKGDDTVNITLGYKKGDDVLTGEEVEDITTADAGVYTVYAKELSDPNYKITVVDADNSAKTDYYIPFIINKKALIKPTLGENAFGSAAFSNDTQNSGGLYGNSEDEKKDWSKVLAEGADPTVLFTAAVTAKRDSKWFSPAESDPDLTIDPTPFEFDVETGVLTFFDAGIYTVTFTLIDSTNYCWYGDGKDAEFDENKANTEYAYAWTDEIRVERLQITAPALGVQRAMEEGKLDDYTPLTELFTGATTDDNNVPYTVIYGRRINNSGVYTYEQSESASPLHLVGDNKRGQYYALLSLNDNYKYNCEWLVDSADTDGSDFVEKVGGKVYELQYTSQDGARVYLLYAVTATQLEAVMRANDYVYGANGYKIGDTVLTEDNKVVRDYLNLNGKINAIEYLNKDEGCTNEKGEVVEKLQPFKTPKYTFFTVNEKNEKIADLTEDDLIEGLPWKAGSYGVVIDITFVEETAFQPLTVTLYFKVLPRELELKWTFKGCDTLETTYNGDTQKPDFAITNIPYKNSIDTPAEPQITYSCADVVLNGNYKQSFIDAATYNINKVSFKSLEGEEQAAAQAVNADFELPKIVSVDFVIKKKKITLAAVATTNHVYGDALDFKADDCLSDDTKNAIFNNDKKDGSLNELIEIKVKQDGNDGYVTDTKNVVYGGNYVLVPVFVSSADNIFSDNYEPDTPTAGTLIVKRRAITVEVTNKPTSVYSEEIDDIEIAVKLTSGETGTACVDDLKDIFTIAACADQTSEDGTAVYTPIDEYSPCDGSTPKYYYIVLTRSGEAGRSNNYDITFGNKDLYYKDDGVNIINTNFMYELKPKSIVEKKINESDSIVAVGFTYNGADTKILKDGFDVVLGNPDRNTPAWYYAIVGKDDPIESVENYTEFSKKDGKYVSPTVKDAGTYYFVIKVEADNHTAFTKKVSLTVAKKELIVDFNLSIMFGEQNPADMRWLFDGEDDKLANLRTDGDNWAVTGFATNADRDLFYGVNDGVRDGFYDLAGVAEYTVENYLPTKLDASYAISFIAKKGEADAVTCKNYTFAAGSTGKLTVNKVKLSVNISDLTVVYNHDGDIPDVNAAASYTVDLPKSTYDKNVSYAKSEDSYIDIFELSTDAHDVKPSATATTGAAGEYAIVGTNKLKDKYEITFVGDWKQADGKLVAAEKGTVGKYSITLAKLKVETDTAGYSDEYDEKWHGIKVKGVDTVKENGDIATDVVYAVASDGTTVKVMFGKSVSEVADTKAEFDKLDKSETAPKYRDAGTYYVYYLLTNDNYEPEVRHLKVAITQAQGTELKFGFNFDNNSVQEVPQSGSVDSKTAWVYGYGGTDGFDPDGKNFVTEPETYFIYSAGTTKGKMTVTLYYVTSNGNERLLQKTVDLDAADTVTDMFAELFENNSDKMRAGEYRLSVSVNQTPNYVGISKTYCFKVDKRALTVKAKTPDEIKYGQNLFGQEETEEDQKTGVPFVDASVGLVKNSSKADASVDKIDDVLGVTPIYATDYKRGNDAASAQSKTYPVYFDNKDEVKNIVNYDVTYEDVYLQVAKREIAVNIKDYENTYSLQNDEKPHTLTFTLKDPTDAIYSSELTDGVPADGVYNNANQGLLTLYTDAIVNDNTNNVKLDGETVVPYTIYAVFNGNNANNYQVSFVGCTNKEKKDVAIGSDGSAQNAGSYLIKKAMFTVDQKGVYHDEEGKDDPVKSEYYSGAVNYYLATLRNPPHNTKLTFTYEELVNGEYVSLGDALGVVEAGTYRAVGKSADTNFSAAELNIPFTIYKAELTIEANAATVQYGTALTLDPETDTALVEAGRFSGFTYKAPTSETMLQSAIDAYLNEYKVTYKTINYDPNSDAGKTGVTIEPVCDTDKNGKHADRNVIPVFKAASLTINKRKVDVTMVGWNDDESLRNDPAKHNPYATVKYLGTYVKTITALQQSFNSHLSSYIHIDEDEVFGAVSGDKRALGQLKIQITGIDGNKYKHGNHEYTYKTDSANYDITFTNVADNAPPKFFVQKAELVLSAGYATPYTETYGNEIATFVQRDRYNIGDLYYSVDGLQTGGNNQPESFFELLKDRNIVFTIVAKNGGAPYEAWKSGVDDYTVSLVISKNGVTSSLLDAEFDNYEIIEVKDATLKLQKRRIAASTQPVTFAFENGVYNKGLFGKAHEAEITFTDLDGSADDTVNVGTYRPSFSLWYNTQSNSALNQVAGKAPTVASTIDQDGNPVDGEYIVRVTLGADTNYTFEVRSAKVNSCELDFAVKQLVISEANLSWDLFNISLDGNTDETFTNCIERYIDDYFDIVRFTYTSNINKGWTINEGDKGDVDCYYIEDNKLYVTTGRNVGVYTVTFKLKDSATRNLTLSSAVTGEITRTFSLTSSTIVMTVTMSDIVYGGRPDDIEVIVDNQIADVGLTLTYAKLNIADANDLNTAVKLAAGSKTGSGLATLSCDGASIDSASLDFFTTITYNAGYYVLKAEYMIGQTTASRYYVFNVAKRSIQAPTFSFTDVKFNGGQQTVSINYESTMNPQIVGNNGSVTNENGVLTLTATYVGEYKIRFLLLDPDNNAWDEDSIDGGEFKDNVLTFSWNIIEDDSANGFIGEPIVSLPQSPDPIEYGGAYDIDSVNVKQGYGSGTVSLFIIPKSQAAQLPAVDDALWQPYDLSGRAIGAGDYWIKAVLAEITQKKNFTPKSTVADFTVARKVITASVTGSMIYGTPLSATDFDDVEIKGLLAGEHATIGNYSYHLAEQYGKLNAGGDYSIILDTDVNGAVTGITAGPNYVVKPVSGVLTVTKRSITVTIENMTADYSVTPDATAVKYTVDDLADGDNAGMLDLVFKIGATSKSAAGGTYYITLDSYNDGNYVVTQERAQYFIEPLKIDVQLIAQQNITFGDSDIKGAMRGSVTIANPLADAQFVNGDLQLVIRFTDSKGYNSETVPQNAGTYTATLVDANPNYTLTGTPSVEFVINKKPVDPAAFYIDSATYTGNKIVPVVNVKKDNGKPIYDSTVFAMTACDFTDAGTHNVTVSLTDPANYVWTSTADSFITLGFVIDKALDAQTADLTITGWQYGLFDAELNSPSAAVKSGERIIYRYSADGVTYTDIVPETGNVGTYYVRVTVAESKNYQAFIGEPVKFEIVKQIVAAPSLTVITSGDGKNDVFTGNNMPSDVVGFDPQLMQIVYDGSIQSAGGKVTVFARDAGEYTVLVSLFNAHNYCWNDGDDDGDGTLALIWTIARKKIARPTHDDSTKIVNGSTIVYLPIGFDADLMTIENNSCSYGGSFDANISLKDTKNYEWEEGGDVPFVITWSIVGADTVFTVIISVLSVLAAVCCALLVTQLLVNKHRKRVAADTMRAIENGEISENEPATENAEQKPQAEQAEQKPQAQPGKAEQSPIEEQTLPEQQKSAEQNKPVKRKSGKSSKGNKGGVQ